MATGMRAGAHRMQMRWRLAGAQVRLLALAAAAASFVLAAFAVLRLGVAVDATAASVLVAVVFGLAAVYQNRQSQRRQHTVGLIAAFTAEDLCLADGWMASRIRTGSAVEADVPAAQEAHVRVLLDYYEFLAVLARRGLVDVPLLLDLRGGAMSRCLELCRPYVQDRRTSVDPGLYACTEMLVGEYARRFGGARG